MFQGIRRKLSLNKAIISYKFYLNVSFDVHSFIDFCIFYNICLWLALSQA